MATAIFFGLPAQGHTNPTLPIVSELVRRGEDVLYYSTEEYRTTIEATGAEFRTYGAIFPTNYASYVKNVVTLVRHLMLASQQIVEQLLDEVQQSRPDYILYDSMAAWGLCFAQILRLPAICSTTVFPCS